MEGLNPPAIIPCPVRQMARQHPHHPAIVLDDFIIDYHELDERLNGLCEQLQNQGWQQGDNLLTLSANSLELLLLSWAALRCGILFCPINPSFPETRWLPLLDTLQIKGYWLPQEQSVTPPPDIPRLELDFTARSAAVHDALLDSAALASLTLTSGSSGEPKAVAHRLRSHMANASGSSTRIPLAPGDLWLLSLPLFHIGGYAIALRCFLAGAAVALPSPQRSLAEQLCQQPVSHLSLVPTQLYRLVQAGFSLRQSRVRHLLLGGAAIPPDLVSRCQQQGLSPYVSYGLSEMASQVCTRHAGANSNNTGTPLPGREVMIRNGEICVRGETLFAGYYRQGELTLPLDEEGWFHTGDLGEFNSEDELIICGRIGNRFISGGENIQPEEIEQQLLTHPAILQAMVVAVPDAEWGAAAVAFIDAATPLDPEELKEWLRPRVARHLVPRHWLCWPTSQTTQLKPGRQEFAQVARALLDPDFSPRD